MRVCVAGELSGGVGVYGRNLVRALYRSGVDITVVAPTPLSPLDFDVDFIEVKCIRGRGRWIPQSAALAAGVSSVSNTVDLIHYTDARFSVFQRQASVPIVGTMNDYFYAITRWFSGAGTASVYRDWRLRHVYYNLIRVIERNVLRRLDQIFCISGTVARALSHNYGMQDAALRVIPYGIDYGYCTRQNRSKDGTQKVLFVGGNYQRKGLHILIEAIASIATRLPTIEVIVAGASPDSDVIRRLIRKRKLETRFRFVGQVNYRTLYEYYSAADVLAMPSLLEAFGIPYLEAMHCGLPVIGSDIEGPDYLEDRWNALTPPAGDVDALGECLLEILENNSLRELLIQNGRATAARFTTERMAKRTIEAYHCLVNG